MSKIDPDLRLPIDVWKKRLPPTAFEVFLILYNGELEQPTTFKHIKDYLDGSVSDVTVREALKTLIKNKCLVMRKVYLAGVQKNLYQLALKYRKRSNRIKYANTKLRHRFQKAGSKKSKSSSRIPTKNTQKGSRVTREKTKTANTKVSDSTALQYSCLETPNTFSVSPLTSNTYVSSKKSLPKFPMRSNSVGITNERMKKRSSQKKRSSKRSQRKESLAHVAETVPRDRLSRIEIARSRIRTKSKRVQNTLSEEVRLREEQEFEKSCGMAHAYEKKLKEYHRSPHLKFLNAFSVNYRGYQSFLKAAKQAEALDMPYAQFIEAQFYYFHRWFSRAPSPYEICGGKGKMPAKSRAMGYLREQKDSRNIHERVTREGRVEKKKLVKSEVIAYNLKLLKGMMSDGSTEKACLLEFAQPSMNFFDPVFLKQNETYRRLRRKGKL